MLPSASLLPYAKCHKSFSNFLLIADFFLFLLLLGFFKFYPDSNYLASCLMLIASIGIVTKDCQCTSSFSCVLLVL
jgi:hypothetical protein